MRPGPLPHGPEWDFELIERYHAAIAETAAEFRLDTYPNQIEIINSEQMLDAYAASGLPIGYPHWSFGKAFIRNEQAYRKGYQGLAYEIVINSSPCIAYLMEENTLTMQALVIAHACYGHNSFFKGNYLFRQFTQADAMLDYLVFARRYVMECEERYGMAEVEEMLDSCHALMDYGVDRYKRPAPISATRERGAPHRARGEPSASSTTICGAPCPAGAPLGRREPRLRVPGGAGGEHPVLRREALAAARAVAARARPHRAQAGAVLLPADPDQGDERGLGHLLALHAAQPAVRQADGGRRLHVRVPAPPHQRGVAARVRREGLSRHQPVRAGLRHDAGHAPHLREADRRGPRLVPRPGRAPTGSRCSTSPCATSRTSPSSPSTCRRA